MKKNYCNEKICSILLRTNKYEQKVTWLMAMALFLALHPLLKGMELHRVELTELKESKSFRNSGNKK